MGEDNLLIPDDNSNRLNGWRTEPLYTIGEASRLAGVAASTVRRWLYGYSPDPRFPHYKSPPVFGDDRPDTPFVSFLELVEIVIARDFRKVGNVSLDVVRQAHAQARVQWSIEYPFAHLELESLGGHIIEWIKREGHGKAAHALDSPAQWSLPGLVAEEVQKLEYWHDLAAKWYPVGKNVPIVVDPLLSSGLPTIAGRGVTVAAIRRRFMAGHMIEIIADDLQLDPALVQWALRYADQVAA
jgi:uncharacterized protein (DUF433 family)